MEPKVFPTCLIALMAFAASAADWPRFRGPMGTGISAETGLLTVWPEGGLTKLWEHPLGEGYSEMIVVGKRVFTMTQFGEKGQKRSYLLAFHIDTGKEVWRGEAGDGFEAVYDGPRSSPTVEGDRVFVLGPRGALSALSVADGAILWQTHLAEDLGAVASVNGFSASALIEGDQLLIETGAGKNGLFSAFNKKTGERLWHALEGGPGCMTPLPVSIFGQRQLVFAKEDALVALDLTGKLLWSFPLTLEGETYATPVFFAPDLVFLSSTRINGALMLRVSKQGDVFRVKEEWANRDMKNHFSSSIGLDGFIFGFDNATLKCISAADSALAWARRGFGKGSLILADGKFFILSDRGKLVIIEASNEAYRQLGSQQVLNGSRCHTAPTIAGGRIYMRNHANMACYALNEAAREVSQ